MEPSRQSPRNRMAALGVSPAEFVERFRRSAGPGGQNVNKVETGVVVEHLPSGLSAVAEDSRSRERNRRLALDRLLDRLESLRAKRKQTLLAQKAKQRRQAARRSKKTKLEQIRQKRRRAETKKLRASPPLE